MISYKEVCSLMKKIISGIIAVLAVFSAYAAVTLNKKYLRTGSQKFSSGVSKENLEWVSRNKYKDTYLISRDGFCLHGALFPNNSDNWVIAVHGYDSEWRGMIRYVRRFLDAGYSVFLPDLRGFGMSDDKRTTMGHLERLDMLDWINKLILEQRAKNIILFGVSMGAATVMLTAGEKLPVNVRAVVEDCGYSSVREEFEYNIMHTVHLPPYPILWISDIITRINDGWSFLRDGNCISAVKRAKVPICFIHGESDTFVPFSMVYKLYNACRNKDKKLFTVPGAEHTEACVKAPEEYWETVFDFIENKLT